MKVIKYDGSEVMCDTLYMDDKNIIADGITIIPLVEVLRIEDAENKR